MNRTLFVNQFGKKPLRLETYLSMKNKRLIRDYNLFYVLQTNMEKDIFKIGISSGTHRLSSYLNSYGKSDRNKCSGVMLYYLTGTKKTDKFGIDKSFARRKEKQLINDLKKYNVRGDERFKISEDRLAEAIFDADTEGRGFKTKKEQQALDNQTLTKQDLVLDVLDHSVFKTNKKKIRTLLLRWNRPSLDDASFDTEETITKIKNLPTSTQARRKAIAYAKKKKLELDLD
jgi:hypothetical protein|tara:strand:+ start:737 stop:1426 length:690 start_codon:yes stop_codon:yes gene_type:complete